MQQYEVIVELKGEVLDTEGRAIRESMGKLGYKDLADVKVSKRFVLDLEGESAAQTAEKLARDILANPVSETFVVRKLSE